MTTLGLVMQVASIGTSIFRFAQRERKRKEVYTFFQKKYRFTEKTIYVETGSLNYPLRAESRFSKNLFKEAAKPFKVLFKAKTVDDSVRESAGEVYLLAFIHVKLSTDDINILTEIKASKELYNDLYELSRGRGSDYSLELIKKQLKTVFRELKRGCKIKNRVKKSGVI